VTPPALPALVACAALAVAGAVRAQDASAIDKEATRASDLAKKARADVQAAGKPARGGGRKVIKLDTLTVEGRIQKPEAFYVLPRSNLNFDELQKTESFVPRIEKSVQKDPF
jgi:hypothetical protein